MTSTLLAVATPMHMIAPVSAGTDSVVWLRTASQTMPAKAGGKRRDDHERIGPGLEIHHDQQIDQHDRAEQPEQQPGEGAVHGLHLARADDRAALWHLAWRCRRSPA